MTPLDEWAYRNILAGTSIEWLVYLVFAKLVSDLLAGVPDRSDTTVSRIEVATQGGCLLGSCRRVGLPLVVGSVRVERGGRGFAVVA